MDTERAKELHQRATGEVPTQDSKGNWRESIEIGQDVHAGLVARAYITDHAPATLAALILAVEALKADKEYDFHVVHCESCDAGRLDYCDTGSELGNDADEMAGKALAAWGKL